MLFGTIVSTLMCFVHGVVLAEPAAQDESAEPALTFSIEVGDQSVVVGEGVAAQLEGNFKNPEVSVTVEPYRVFARRGVEFEYPRTFNWEADLSDPDVAIWTLSGHTFKIMFFAFNDDTTAEDIVESLVGNFEQQGAEVAKSATQIVLGGETIHGTQLDLSVVGTKITDRVFALPGDGTRSRVVIFQDSLDEENQASAEGVATLKLFTSSFKLTDAAK